MQPDVGVSSQVRFGIKDLARCQVELRLEISRIDLKKEIPFFHLLVIMDRNTNNRSGNTRGNAPARRFIWLFYQSRIGVLGEALANDQADRSGLTGLIALGSGCDAFWVFSTYRMDSNGYPYEISDFTDFRPSRLFAKWPEKLSGRSSFLYRIPQGGSRIEI
jgi:hypothetical protein